MMSKKITILSVALVLMNSATALAAVNNVIENYDCTVNNKSVMANTICMTTDSTINQNCAKSGNSKVDSQTSQNEEPFVVCEKMPQFEGGLEGLMKYVCQNIKYPESAQKSGITGRMMVSFVINKDGSISAEETKVVTVDNMKIDDGDNLGEILVVGYADAKKAKTGAEVTEEEKSNVKQAYNDLEAESIRVVNSMPNWLPGMQKGQYVRVRYTLPITYRLQ